MIQDLRQEFNSFKGPITEATIRHLIEKREGIPWAANRRLKTLDDIVFWIGAGIGTTDKDISIAKTKLVSVFIHSFTSHDAEGKIEV